MQILSKEINLWTGAVVRLNQIDTENNYTVLYIFGDTVVLIDAFGKPLNINRSIISQIVNINNGMEPGFYIVTPKDAATVSDDQIVIAGYFNGSYWLLSNSKNSCSRKSFQHRYTAQKPFTTQNIMRVFDLMLVILPVNSGDKPAIDTTADSRPSNCRNRLRDEGKAYPKSGCGHCKTGGMTGCQFEMDKVAE